MFRFISATLILCIIAKLTSAHVFTALPDMEALLANEIQTADIVGRYVDEEIQRLNRLKKSAEEYQSKAKKGLLNVNSPVGSYLSMKQLHNDWSDIETTMRSDTLQTLFQNVTNHRQATPVKFPEADDLKGAAIALMRLQDVYNLKVSDLAKGRVVGVDNRPDNHLSAWDCFQFAQIALGEFDYYHALAWLEEALKRVDTEDHPTIEKAHILEHLAFAMYQQGNLKRALTITEEWVKLDPSNNRAHGAIAYYLHHRSEAEASQELKQASTSTDVPPVKNNRKYDAAIEKQDVFEALCRGENGPSDAEKSKLFCYYKRDKAFLKLAPLKAEVVHLNPKMIIFRQIVSDKEIDIIKKMITSKLKTATVVVPGGVAPSKVRTAKSGWLQFKDQIVVDLNKRLEDMTNLDSKYSEDIHIVKYNIAGHYDPHYDFFNVPGIEKERMTNDDRIATLIYYLSDVEAGGATAFPDINLALFPSKNDAILWHNLYRNGSIDLRTRHGACPILSGVKWVGNKWIRERGQEFLRKCSLDKDFDE